MATHRRPPAVAPVLGLLLLASATLARAQVSVPALESPVTQDFDTLATTGTSGTLPAGWAFSEAGTNADTTYAAGTGSSNAGNTYSFGPAGDPDRALGGLQSGTLIPTLGASFRNDTGGTITSLAIAYTGEQWRLGTAGRTDRLDFQYSLDATSLTTGTWVDADDLDFTAPVTTSPTGARDGNSAPNRTARGATLAGLAIPPTAVFWIRWMDFNASGADDGLGVDEFSLTASGVGGALGLSIGDAAAVEGDSGTVTATFTVSLSAPAPPGGVSFDIATRDGTATVAGGDYVARSLTGQLIAEGASTYTFDVTVNGDTAVEPDETFFVDVTNVVGAAAVDGEGLGTITNDDVSLVGIHEIQGSGAASPLAGAVVTTRGIVTGVKSNGFFVQEPDASADADPATSEGIFVFTGSAPPPAAAVGNLVQVTGTVSEFVPAADPFQAPLTELTSPTVVFLSGGNPLPAAVPLTTTFPDPAGGFDQLERLEGMRVSVASLTVTGPTLGNVSEPNATGTTTGVFYGVVTGVPRPFREPGVQVPDPLPPGAPCCVPRFDTNPERIRVDSDGLVGAAPIDVGAGAAVTGLVGPLDYSFRTYTVLPDPATPPGVVGGPAPTPASVPSADEVTVAAFNLERFFDTVNDPGIGDPVLTAAAFERRLAKGSLAIRDYLRTPDVLGVIEVENLSTLQALAARINGDAVAAAQPDPGYVAYLEEGNDVGGIDVGFLVKTAPVAAGFPRVEVVEVVQEGKDVTWVDPSDDAPRLLNDRPSLRLSARVYAPDLSVFPVTVIVNHLRSLIGVSSEDPDGLTTEGVRVRAKRRQQAEWLAGVVQARQVADPGERIVLLGDFNAFEFNDGYVDSMGTIAGTPASPNDVVLASPDLVSPDLVNLGDTAPLSERYSFVFDGNAQSLDHVLVNAPLVAATVARRVEHPRIGADFPQTARNDGATPTRVADHDPVVAYFAVAAAPPGAAATPAGGLVTTEAGGSASFDVVLTGPPLADVTIDVSSSDPAEGTPDVASLTFTPADWDTPRTIAVTGADDFVDDGDAAYLVVLGPAASGDPRYDGLDPADVSVTNQDDDAAGITVTAPPSGTTEGGGTAAIVVALDSQPLADVAVRVASSDPTEGTVSVSLLTFTPADWSVARTVTVTGVDDGVLDGPVAYTIVLGPAASADPLYDGLDPPDVPLVNEDDETPPAGPLLRIGDSGGTGATLLLPYFEVDLGGGVTTLLAINNASAAAALARVTLWTDEGVRTLGFNLYLTGYDVQSINLRDVFQGLLPGTASTGQDPADTISPQGALSQDLSFPACAGLLPPAPPGPAFLADLRAAHTGQPSAVFGGDCAGRDLGDGIVRGYLTVDAVGECGISGPGDPGYFQAGGTGVATNQNVLWGDYFIVDPAGNLAHGDRLVAIEASAADPRTDGAGDYTFYGHLVGGTGADNREPLATSFATRYLSGGAFSGGTSLLAWRDRGSATPDATFACGSPPLELEQSRLLAFDESENVVDLAGSRPFSAASQRTGVGGSELPVASPFGWLLIGLDAGPGPHFGTTRQGFVATAMEAEGRFGVGFRAISLDSASTSGR